MMKKILALLVVAVLAMTAGCSKKTENMEENTVTNKVEEKAEAPEKSLEELCANKMFFTIEMENGDVMKGEVYPDLAPKTVKNFVSL